MACHSNTASTMLPTTPGGASTAALNCAMLDSCLFPTTCTQHVSVIDNHDSVTICRDGFVMSFCVIVNAPRECQLRSTRQFADHQPRHGNMYGQLFV